MTKAEIIRMAREAGICTWTVLPQEAVERFERFAELVVAKEREEIAKMFDGAVWAYDYRQIAAAIRNRKNR